MKHAEFVHLHVHSEYSLLDGAIRVSDLVNAAVKHKMPALALTDHGNMFGAIEFYRQASKNGVKPIIGLECYLSPGDMGKRSGKENPDHLVLLARDETGYGNLLALTTASYLEGFYYKPRIDLDLLSSHSQGLVALSSCLSGRLAKSVVADQETDAVETAGRYREIFGDGNFYVELQNHDLPDEQKAITALRRLASREGLPMVATNDCHYLKADDWEAHDVLLCIQTGKFVSDTDRMRFDSREMYFKSPAEMKKLFAEVPEALENTIRIAEKCNLALDFDKFHLPRFPLPEGYDSPDAYLRALVEQELPNRITGEAGEEVRARIAFELETIIGMGYSGYFLIVRDFIEAARRLNVPVGPGRGSAAGSLVSFILGITDIDPLKYGLLFERFLNPERVTLPDIDIDFSDRGRDRIIQYVIEKYGAENVTQIITFGRMKAKAVIRDVGRVLELSYAEADRIAKLIPDRLGITLDMAVSSVPELRQMASSDGPEGHLLEVAGKLEGLVRHASTHAAGVVIAPDKLIRYTPLFKSSKGETTTQFDMSSLEAIGLLKMDFLGLRTLTVIEDCLALIREHRGESIRVEDIPLDDEDTFKLLIQAETLGIFQLESSGMRELLRQMRIDSFEDLIAVIALYRPGPLGSQMLDEYIECKRGKKKITYKHPDLEPILKETYGIILYQEQVMEIARTMAGFSLGRADMLRRAMGKKKPEVMEEQKRHFIDGATSTGTDQKTAEHIFDLITYFAEYGFNKSHSAAYALISYRTAYLKSHYPVEFMAASLTSEMERTDRVVTLIDECNRMDIEVLPPDINQSTADFKVDGQRIRFGLAAVKNVGRAAIESIIAAANEGEVFEDIFGFCKSIDPRQVNRKVIESLIQAGALDSLGGHRAQLIQALDKAIEAAQSHHRDRERGQTSLLAVAEEASGWETEERALPEVPAWSNSEKLSREKELLGFYVSGHPMSRFSQHLADFSQMELARLSDIADGKEMVTGGIIVKTQTKIDRRGNLMAFCTLEDFSGAVECLVFSDCYERYSELLQSEKMVLVRGRVSSREEEQPKLVLNWVGSLESVYRDIEYPVQILLSTKELDEDQLNRLKGSLVPPGRQAAPLQILIQSGQYGQMGFRSKKYGVLREPAALEALRNVLGDDRVRIKPKMPANDLPKRNKRAANRF
ncbi:DNA polymerase III subunit alpha [candidate division KSB1 bacterium]